MVDRGDIAGRGRVVRIKRPSLAVAIDVPHRRRGGERWANSLGILAGGITPPAIGWIKDVTGSYEGGLYLLAAWGLMGAIIAALCVRETAAKLAAEDALEAT